MQIRSFLEDWLINFLPSTLSLTTSKSTAQMWIQMSTWRKYCTQENSRDACCASDRQVPSAYHQKEDPRVCEHPHVYMYCPRKLLHFTAVHTPFFELFWRTRKTCCDNAEESHDTNQTSRVRRVSVWLVQEKTKLTATRQSNTPADAHHISREAMAGVGFWIWSRWIFAAQVEMSGWAWGRSVAFTVWGSVGCVTYALRHLLYGLLAMLGATREQNNAR